MRIQRPTFQRPEPPAPDGAATRVAITLGDPNGIGPEVVLKSLHDPSLVPSMTPVLIGSAHVLRVHADVLGFSDLDIHVVDEIPEEVPHGDVALLDVADADEPPVTFGAVTAEAGRLAMRAVERAVDECLKGTVDAMVTAPISKAAINEAGYDVPGHTEFIARRTESAKPTMMMVAGGLRVGLVTSHVSIADVPAMVTEEAILEKLRVIDESLRTDFAIEEPKIAVLALNPSAGHADGLRAERADKLALAAAVAIALPRAVAAAVAEAAEKRRQLLVEQRLDGRADGFPQPVLDRVVPGPAGQWRKAGRICSLGHGVISPAVGAAGRGGFQITRRLRRSPISTTSETRPGEHAR